MTTEEPTNPQPPILGSISYGKTWLHRSTPPINNVTDDNDTSTGESHQTEADQT